ncbi:hypothetical protein [Neptunitalea lumnitzerae]|uniref:Uncharacterized protein n=1 Tax=Neptunitalea lumnitzerae TaxID=2965509 RepID=A0ABQ5MIQ3_9FLAO|nr:hypothetical protein [Neptunitalea sp. Y10]GLB49269.1 hypothetical protein Y10_16370 [Neptunitalea sp. Y10]
MKIEYSSFDDEILNWKSILLNDSSIQGSFLDKNILLLSVKEINTMSNILIFNLETRELLKIRDHKFLTTSLPLVMFNSNKNRLIIPHLPTLNDDDTYSLDLYYYKVENNSVVYLFNKVINERDNIYEENVLKDILLKQNSQ